jgi:site-specific DNA-methyltransferase (adenine-specific)
MTCQLLLGDCRDVMPKQGLTDVVIADPPYGDTSLEWDSRVDGWLGLVRHTLKPHGSLWVFGSMRFFMASAEHFRAAGWRYAQDCVWEKHNGSSFHADRFKRVHEHIVQFYPADVPWAAIYKKPVTTPDATARTVRRKKRPPHTGHIEAGSYTSEDGGPRLMRSVIAVRSCHGYAEHPTQKPEGIITPLIEFSCPPGGTVGDWFAGSGSVGVSALKLGRSYVGCEIDAGYYAIARRRLDEARGDLFAMS